MVATLPERVTRFVEEQALFLDGEGVVVAVSGGADSTALLHLLHHLPEAGGPRPRLVVAHLDHGVRTDSGAVAAHVAAAAADLGLPFEGGRPESPLVAGPGFELEARRARYRFLVRVASDHGAARVAIAHHRDDRVETILHRLLQGATLDGLAGLPVRRPIAPGAPVHVVRPLWNEPRAALRQWLRERGIAWDEDPTNAGDGNARARLRASVLPAVEAAYPGARTALLGLAQAGTEARRLLEAAARSLPLVDVAGRPALDRTALAAAGPEVRRRAVEALLAGTTEARAAFPRVARERLDAALAVDDGATRQVPVGGGLTLVVGPRSVRVEAQ